MSAAYPLGNWSDWLLAQTGTGAATVSAAGRILTCTGGSGTALATRRLSVRPGEVLRLSVIARVVAGSLTSGQGLTIRVHRPGVGPVISNTQTIPFADLSEVPLSVAVPLAAGADCYAELEVKASAGNTIELSSPKLSIGQGVVAPVRCMALGVLRWNAGSGAFALPDDYQHAGIVSQAYSAGTKTLTLTLDSVPAGLGVAPVCFAQLSNSVQAPALQAKLSAYDCAAGTVDIKFFDTGASAFVDLAAIASLALDVFFKAEL